MSSLNSSSLCVEHDEAGMPTLHPLCFVFTLQAHSFLPARDWDERGGPACKSGFVQENCAEMQLSLMAVQGSVLSRGPRAASALSVERQMARRSLV